MQKTVVRNPNQSSIRRNLLNIAGIVVQGETITPLNGDRQLGGYGVAWLNNQDAASQTTGQDNPLPECNCESGGGGGGSGSVQPSGNCEKKNISELKQILDDYANQSFCDKEFPDVQFSTFIGYDSTGKEIELRMLCPVDDCQQRGVLNVTVDKRLRFGTDDLIYDRRHTETISNITKGEALAWIYDYFQDACSGYIAYGKQLQGCGFCTTGSSNPSCRLCDNCACISGCNNRTIPNGSCDIFIQFNCNDPSIIYLTIYISAAMTLDDGTYIILNKELDFSRYGTI